MNIEQSLYAEMTIHIEKYRAIAATTIFMDNDLCICMNEIAIKTLRDEMSAIFNAPHVSDKSISFRGLPIVLCEVPTTQAWYCVGVQPTKYLHN